jgi:hypothetical protein
VLIATVTTLAATGHWLTASYTHTASDVFVILKARRPARGAVPKDRRR